MGRLIGFIGLRFRLGLGFIGLRGLRKGEKILIRQPAFYSVLLPLHEILNPDYTHRPLSSSVLGLP